MCLQHSEAADRSPVLTTPGGLVTDTAKHGGGLIKGLTRGSTATRWPRPQLLGHFSEGAGTHLREPAVQGCRSQGALRSSLSSVTTVT